MTSHPVLLRSVHEVANLPAHVRLIDVREPHEFNAELGHIARAELVPMGQVMSVAPSWNRDEELVFVCRSGNRSGRVAAALAAGGFTRVINMDGGMIAWNAAGLPVAR